MKIWLIQIDKTDEKWLIEGIEKYEKRLKHYILFESKTFLIPKSVRSKTVEEQKKEEGKILVKAIEKMDQVFLLDEKGKQHSSAQFAQLLQKSANEGKKNICFVIGGPYGFSEEVYAAIKTKIGLSEMTFS
ncbi:MAG: 23S rRNA (pseudouridine(1915)-N(3))-methyltransferase RlmH, partial [Bacteroidia bacterium]